MEQMIQADWYYIGHYGQLGPLTREQVDELIGGGVITRETYVWKGGMSSWVPAEAVPDLLPTFRESDPYLSPPPPPMPTAPAPPVTAFGIAPAASPQMPYGAQGYGYMPVHALKSDKSRTLAGVLNLVIPGVGRMYLGYAAHGVLQLVLTICTGGVLWVWSAIDGVLMLTGNVRHDGYGRVLSD